MASSEDVRLCGRVIGCGFSFDERGFRDYCELFILAHDKACGWIFVFGFGLISFVMGLLSAPLMEWAMGKAPESAGQVAFHSVFFLLFVVFFSFVVIGARMMLGLRRPRWERRRWVARTRIAFERMSKSDTENPLCMYLPWEKQPRDEWPRLFTFYYLADLLTPLRFHSSGLFDKPIAFDVIPGLFPRYPMLEGVELSVRFSAAFYPDRIEKGSHGVVFARSYADVHDVVEHRRHPGLAILRHENGYSQLVVRTDLLAPGEWDEVKDRIERAKEERLRGLGPVARVRELFK